MDFLEKHRKGGKHKHPKPSPNPPPSQPRILVIGSGCSGIAAASSLLIQGYKNVTILEARDRIGGRTWTDRRWGKSVPVDLGWCFVSSLARVQPSLERVLTVRCLRIGCMYVHGINGNPIQELFGPRLGLVIPKDRFSRYPLHGPCNSSEKLPSEISKLIGTRIAELMRKAVEHGKKNPEVVMSFQQFLEIPEINAWFLDGFPDGSNERSALLGMLDSISGFEAAPLDDLSLVMFATEAERHGPDAFVTKGYDGVLKAMLAQAGVKEDEVVKKGNVVEMVEYAGADGVVQVTTRDGTVYEADYLVCTIPLGVLKASHVSLFSPPLPPSMATAISDMGFGTLDKLVFKFPRTWWNAEHDHFATFLPHSDIIEAVSKQFGKIEQREQDEESTLCPAPEGNFHLLSFFSISYYHRRPRSSDNHLEEEQEQDHKHKRRYPPVLACWTATSFAEAVEHLPDSTVSNIIMNHLRTRIFPDKEIPDPKEMIATRWSSDPFSRGSYSYLSTEMGPRSSALLQLRSLAQPLSAGDGKKRVFFAGEHTSERSFSYQHGAFESGIRAAREVVAEIRGKKLDKGWSGFEMEREEVEEEEGNGGLCGCRFM